MSALPPPGTHYALYARYSTVHQHFKSIEDQIALCRDYAGQHGWVEAGAYHDAERSGTTFEGRAGFFELMAAADRGEFGVVVVEDLDRLSRQASGAHGLVEELEFLDIAICTVNSGLVTDMEVAFKAVQNASYVKNLAAKSRRGVEGTVKSGLISGRLAYGYRKVFTPDGKNGQREKDPNQEPIVERIFRDYDGGVSPLAICRALNAENVPGPGGRPWKPGVLYGNKDTGTGILRNKLYIGINEWGRTAIKRNRHKGTTVAKPMPASTWVKVEVPDLRIIDDDLFWSVQARIEANKNPRFFEQRKAEYLLTGLCYCGVCGAKYQILQEKLGCTGRALQGTCNNRRRVYREDLEEAVLGGLKQRLLSEALIDPYLAEYREEIERVLAEQQGRAQSSEARQRDLKRQIDNIMMQIREGKLQGFAGQLVSQELDRLEAERQQLERAAKHRPREAPILLDGSSVIARLHTLLDDLRCALTQDGRDAVRARDLIRGMIDRVVITPLAGDRLDGRGIGPVRITIEGRLSGLLDLADANRVVQHTSRPETLLGHANLTFRYYIDFIPVDSRLLPHGYDDLAVVGHALDDAEGPVKKTDFIDALAKAEGVEPDYRLDMPITKRVDHAIDYLVKRKEIRSIPWRHFSGYVWNHIPLSDDQWKEKARSRPDPTHVPLPVIRLSAPEADVVVIGRKVGFGSETEDDEPD